MPIRLGLHANPWFLGLWLVVFGLIFVLLGLAMIDWVDLNRYARRKKSAISREKLSLIHSHLERRKDQDAAKDELSQRSDEFP